MTADLPPMPPSIVQPLHSPKYTEHLQSLQKVSAKVVSVPVPQAAPVGFAITNITVVKGNWTIGWQNGTPPFQVELNNGQGWVSVGTTINHSFTFPVVGRAGMVRVGYATEFIAGTGSLNTPQNIAMRSDGLHAVPVSDGTKAELVLWTGTNDLRKIAVPGYNYFRNPVCQLVGASAIIADTRYSGQPNRFTEFTLSNDTLLPVKDFDFGLSGSGMASCVVDGKVFVFSQLATNNTSILVSSVLRNTDGSYNTNSFSIGSSSQISEAVTMTAVGYHGLAYLFNVVDGGACVSVTLVSSTNTLLFNNVAFIQQDSDLGCSGEFPYPTSVVDTFNDRILLGYCSSPEDMSCCAGDGDAICAIAGRSSVVTLCSTNDLTVQNNVTLLATTPWWSWHADYPLVCMFPGPLSLNTVTENANLVGCDRSQISYQAGTITKGFNAGATVVSGASCDIASFSTDGWVLARSPDMKYRVFRVP